MLEKILIVDDDPEFRQELKDFLNEYEVLEASSGNECLKLLRRANEIRLLILDVRMPGLSGIEVLEQIKKTDPDIGIIILTGYSSKDMAIEALKGRADDYVEKPVDPVKLNESIEALLARRRGEPDISASSIEDKIKKVKRFTEKNKFKKTTLKEASNCVYLSPKYLSRIFKQVTGESFSNYRLAIKIDAAKEMLKKTGYNINQISDRLGYENTESFIRQFKIRTKKTPTQFRNKIKKPRKAKAKK